MTETDECFQCSFESRSFDSLHFFVSNICVSRVNQFEERSMLLFLKVSSSLFFISITDTFTINYTSHLKLPLKMNFLPTFAVTITKVYMSNVLQIQSSNTTYWMFWVTRGGLPENLHQTILTVSNLSFFLVFKPASLFFKPASLSVFVCCCLSGLIEDYAWGVLEQLKMWHITPFYWC